jgi:hypothetical protein
MQQLVPEVFLQRAYATHLHMLGLQVREEVRFGGSRFDIVAFNGSKVLGFEVKLSSWNKALRQARIYKLCCDEVYLVIPASKLSHSIVSRCLAEGVGLAAIGHPPSWPINTILAAQESEVRNVLHSASIKRIASFQ